MKALRQFEEVAATRQTGVTRVLAAGLDPSALESLTRHASTLGVEIAWAGSEVSGAPLVAEPDLLIVGLGDEPDEELRTWQAALRPLSNRPRIVALVARPSMAAALRAAQLGVFDVLTAPVGRAQFAELMERVRLARTESVLPLPTVEAPPSESGELITGSPAMVRVFRTVAQVAPSTASVLVRGASGTGKELVARAIHRHSARVKGPFVAVNCAAIPEDLLESELFGHEKGAFTGAIVRKFGRFERANGGTLLLDEVGDMSLTLQGKILRAVQEREIERVGGVAPISVDVRLVAATHRDIERLIEKGRFREDLYYRLAVVTIDLPSLVDRGDDLLLLTAAFLKEFGRTHGKQFSGITDRAKQMLLGHHWSGNVRELRNVIERAVLVADDHVLRAEHLPESWSAEERPSPEPEPGPLATLEEVERVQIRRVLSYTEHCVKEAAEILGVHRNTLARKMKKYDL